MDEHLSAALMDDESTSFVARHRYFILIIFTIIMALILVVISMWMYYASGDAQLDLSRPGYTSVRSQAVDTSGKYQNYPTTGSVTDSSINDFKKQFKEQATNAKAVDAFNGDPLNPSVLGMTSAN
jgi:hypothetical protein